MNKERSVISNENSGRLSNYESKLTRSFGCYVLISIFRLPSRPCFEQSLPKQWLIQYGYKARPIPGRYRTLQTAIFDSRTPLTWWAVLGLSCQVESFHPHSFPGVRLELHFSGSPRIFQLPDLTPFIFLTGIFPGKMLAHLIAQYPLAPTSWRIPK